MNRQLKIRRPRNHPDGVVDSSKLTVRFGDCRAGWISMWLEIADAEEQRFWFTNIYDSAPQLLAWLECIAIGGERCGFRLDEEIYEVDFEFSVEHHKPRLVIRRESELLLDLEVSGPVITAAFYQAFVHFSESADYRAEEWEFRCLSDTVELTTRKPFAAWVASVLHLDQRGLQKAIWRFDPELGKPSRYSGNNEGSKAEVLELGLDPDSNPGLVPHYWDIDHWWDEWNASERANYLTELGMECVIDWRGCPWPRLRSPLLEQWVGRKNPQTSDDAARWLMPIRFDPKTQELLDDMTLLTPQHFKIGQEFFTESGRWRCTDVGSRTICGIRIDNVTHDWLNGPPYAVVEMVFDEDSFPTMLLCPELP